MRRLTKYEMERVEQLLVNWAQSKLGATLSGYASTSAYDDQIEARTASFETRYPVIQVDADRVDAVVFGRPATQFLSAIAPMRDEWREPLIMYYVGNLGQADIARRLKIAQQTVADRLAAAKFTVWSAISEKCDSAKTHASQRFHSV